MQSGNLTQQPICQNCVQHMITPIKLTTSVNYITTVTAIIQHDIIVMIELNSVIGADLLTS